MNFGKYKKAKYQLIVNGDVVYSFVTTSRPEEECVQILKEKSDFYRGAVNKWYSITKNTDGKNLTIFSGKIEKFN